MVGKLRKTMVNFLLSWEVFDSKKSGRLVILLRTRYTAWEVSEPLRAWTNSRCGPVAVGDQPAGKVSHQKKVFVIKVSQGTVCTSSYCIF